MKIITSILVALAITFGWPPSTSEAKPLTSGHPLEIWVFCDNLIDLEKMAMILVMQDNDAYVALLNNNDVKCFSSRLGHFPTIQGAAFVKYLKIEIMTLTGRKLYGAEAFWQGMTLYFFLDESLGPELSNNI